MYRQTCQERKIERETETVVKVPPKVDWGQWECLGCQKCLVSRQIHDNGSYNEVIIGEDDLEAELLALTGGKSTSKGSKKPKGAGNMSMADIDKMMASVKDIGEGDDDDDDQMSGEDIDEDDLLAELQVL